MGKIIICGAMCALLDYFRIKKPPLDRFYNIGAHMGWECFVELFLYNIMKFGKNYIEWQTSIHFWDYLRKRDGSFKFQNRHVMIIEKQNLVGWKLDDFEKIETNHPIFQFMVY